MRAGAYVVLGIFGIGALGLVSAYYDAAANPTSTATHKASPPPTDTTEITRDTGTNATVPLGIAIAGLCTYAVYDRRRKLDRTANQSDAVPVAVAAAAVHDEMPFDPDSDLTFLNTAMRLWDTFSPDTGRFGEESL
jgi:hypothetical protein